ncbi:MAG: hypothetical protein RSB99_02160 [Bacilli bacterium]
MKKALGEEMFKSNNCLDVVKALEERRIDFLSLLSIFEQIAILDFDGATISFKRSNTIEKTRVEVDDDYEYNITTKLNIELIENDIIHHGIILTRPQSLKGFIPDYTYKGDIDTYQVPYRQVDLDYKEVNKNISYLELESNFKNYNIEERFPALNCYLKTVKDYLETYPKSYLSDFELQLIFDDTLSNYYQSEKVISRDYDNFDRDEKGKYQYTLKNKKCA